MPASHIVIREPFMNLPVPVVALSGIDRNVEPLQGDPLVQRLAPRQSRTKRSADIVAGACKSKASKAQATGTGKAALFQEST